MKPYSPIKEAKANSQTTKPKISPVKKAKTVAKRTDRGVPYDEMRRLMREYGSVKCLRKRQASAGEENAKIDSVKRKFYRWFSDLDKRFEKDEEGVYRPKAGHEAEIEYRERMRTQDQESLAKKRVKCRKQRYGAKEGKTSRTKRKATSTASPTLAKSKCKIVHQVSIPPDVTSSLRKLELNSHAENGIKLEFDHDPIASAADIVSDTEPLEPSFIAEEGIFDDVEKSFYGQTVQDCPILAWPPCSGSETEESTMAWDSDSASIKDVLEKSIEECCEEILGSEDDDTSLSGCLLDIIT